MAFYLFFDSGNDHTSSAASASVAGRHTEAAGNSVLRDVVSFAAVHDILVTPLLLFLSTPDHGSGQLSNHISQKTTNDS